VTNLSTTNNFCSVTTSFNKPVVGKQIGNVSKENNRTKWTLSASISHSIIAIGNIKSQKREYSNYSVIKLLNAKAAVLFLKNSSDFPPKKLKK
jgi:hypothetical protein